MQQWFGLSWCICYVTVMKKETMTLRYKNIYNSSFFLRVIASEVCVCVCVCVCEYVCLWGCVCVKEREREKWERESDEWSWIQTAILTHNFFFSWPYKRCYIQGFFFFFTRRTQLGIAYGPRLHAGRDSFSADSPVSQVGLYIYNFTTPAHFRLDMRLLLRIYIEISEFQLS